MNRLSRIAPLLLTLAVLATVPAVSPAASKNDGRPDGGSLAYGEYGRPATLDPVTSNEMITPRKVRYEFIERVEKVDDAAVRFTLKRPILNALAKFSFKIIPAHGPANSQFLTREDPFVRSPIGTGPYVVKGVTADREIVLM